MVLPPLDRIPSFGCSDDFNPAGALLQLSQTSQDVKYFRPGSISFGGSGIASPNLASSPSKPIEKHVQASISPASHSKVGSCCKRAIQDVTLEGAEGQPCKQGPMHSTLEDVKQPVQELATAYQKVALENLGSAKSPVVLEAALGNPEHSQTKDTPFPSTSLASSPPVVENNGLGFPCETTPSLSNPDDAACAVASKSSSELPHNLSSQSGDDYIGRENEVNESAFVPAAQDTISGETRSFDSSSKALDIPSTTPTTQVETYPNVEAGSNSKFSEVSSEAENSEPVMKTSDVRHCRRSHNTQLHAHCGRRQASRSRIRNVSESPLRCTSAHSGSWCQWTRTKLSGITHAMQSYTRCKGMFRHGQSHTCSYKPKEQCPAVGKRGKRLPSIERNKCSSKIEDFLVTCVQHLNQNPDMLNADSSDLPADRQSSKVAESCRILSELCSQMPSESTEETDSIGTSVTPHLHHHQPLVIIQPLVPACLGGESCCETQCSHDTTTFRHRVAVVVAALTKSHTRYLMKLSLCAWSQYHTLRRTEDLRLVALRGHANAAVAVVTRCNKSSLLFVAFRSWAHWADKSCVQQESEARLVEIEAHQMQLEREWNDQVRLINESHAHETTYLEQQIQHAQEVHAQVLQETRTKRLWDVQCWTQKICNSLMIARSRDIYGIIFSHWMRTARSQCHMNELENLAAAHRQELETKKLQLRQPKDMQMFLAEKNSSEYFDKLDMRSERCSVGVRSLCDFGKTLGKSTSTTLASNLGEKEQDSMAALSAMKLDLLRRSLEVVDDRRRYDLLLLLPGMQRIAQQNCIVSERSRLPQYPPSVQSNDTMDLSTDDGSDDKQPKSIGVSQQRFNPGAKRRCRSNASHSDGQVRRQPAQRRWSQRVTRNEAAKVQDIAPPKKHGRPKRRVRQMVSINPEDRMQVRDTPTPPSDFH